MHTDALWLSHLRRSAEEKNERAVRKSKTLTQHTVQGPKLNWLSQSLVCNPNSYFTCDSYSELRGRQVKAAYETSCITSIKFEKITPDDPKNFQR